MLLAHPQTLTKSVFTGLQILLRSCSHKVGGDAGGRNSSALTVIRGVNRVCSVSSLVHLYIFLHSCTSLHTNTELYKRGSIFSWSSSFSSSIVSVHVRQLLLTRVVRVVFFSLFRTLLHSQYTNPRQRWGAFLMCVVFRGVRNLRSSLMMQWL